MAIRELAVIHMGQNGQTVCTKSPLLVAKTTLDVQAVDCLDCLFGANTQALNALSIVTARLRVVIKEASALQLVELKS